MDMIVNSIVSNYLADYFEINPEKTKTSILSGTIELSGVKFKKNLFTTLNLPYLELEDGYIGRIKLQLSLPRFYLYPIIILVDQIYIKVRPKNVNKITEKEILEAYEKYKQKKLKEFEELMNVKFSSIFEDENAGNNNGGYSIVESIINNLHINIEKIVFIFDDCISNPSYPYTLGVSLNKLYIDSTSKDFIELQEEIEDDNSPFKYKKLEIENLNIFLDKINKEDIVKDEKTGDISANHKIKEDKPNTLDDNEKIYLKDSLNFFLYCESEIDNYSKDEKYHSYLLRELNFQIRLITNKKYEENKEPQINVVIEVPKILTKITNRQMKAISNNINYISLKDLYQQSTIDNYYKERKKIDNDTIKQYLKDYSLYYKTKYIEIYKDAEENKKYLEKLEKIEKNLDLDNIRSLRELGNDIIKNIIEIGKIDKQIQDKESSWSYFFSSSSMDVEKLKKQRTLKIEEQKKIEEKNSAMNLFKHYISGMLKNKDDKPIKKEDKVQIIFKLIMSEFVIIIQKEKKTEKRNIFEMRFTLFKIDTLVKTLSQSIKISLKDIEFRQFLSPNKEYEKILFSKVKNDSNSTNDSEVSLMLVEFENNFLLPISPFKFKLHFDKQIYIIIDYYYLYYLYNLFLKHIESIDLNNLTSMVNEKITKVVKDGYKNLLETKEKEKEKMENLNAKLFNINVDILLNAPILLLPLHFMDENNTELMYISLGQLKINSQLADDNKNEIYDKYITEFSNICIKTISQNNNIDNINDEKGEKLIYPTSFSINIENYIYKIQKAEHKNKPDFSPLLVNIVINNTKFNLNEEQIIFAIKYLDNFQRTQFNFEKKEALKEKMKLKRNQIMEKDEKDEKIQLKSDKKEEELKDKNEKKNIEDKKEEKKEGNKKNKEISNVIKLNLKFGAMQMILQKNLINGEADQKISFLQFFFRESTMDFLMKSNGSMKMDISFGHFYLYDKDYKLDEQKNKVTYINPEFKCIVGTTAHGIRDSKNNKIKFSEIYNFNNDPNLNESVKISFCLDTENNMTSVDIAMSKLTISPNFSTLFRLNAFSNKYLNLYNELTSKLKQEKLRDKAQEEKVQKNKTSFPVSKNIKLDENLKEKQKLKDNVDNDIIKLEEHSKMNITLLMKGIDIYIPIEPNSKNTSIIFMTIEIPISYSMETDVESEFNSKQLLRMFYKIKKSELNVQIEKSNFSVYDYKDDIILLNSINQIIENIDLSFLMKNELDNNNKLNKFYIEVQMNKGLEISFNISHIIVFSNILDKVNAFLNELNKKENDEKKINVNDEIDEEIKRVRTEELIKVETIKREKDLLKKKDDKKININNYVDIVSYKFIVSNIAIRFYDIINGIYQSLIEFSLTKTQIEFLQNSNPKDSTNLENYLISTFKHDIKELNTYDKNNFYMYFNVITNMEIKSLNNYLNQWEHFMEPVEVKFYYCQFLKKMRPNIELFTTNMLNINLTLNLAKILAVLLNKFSMNKEQLQKNKERKLLKDETIPEKIIYLGIESPILILENYSGVDMEIWFDNIKYEENNEAIIKLKNNQKFEFTNSTIKKYNVERKNNNLNSTLSYKFCLDKDLMKNANITEKDITGNNLNLNYHHINLHDISESVKISIESCSDNLLCRHIIFNSLISVRNDTKYKDIQLCNKDNTQKIDLKDNKKKNVPLSWFLYNKNNNVSLLYNNDIQILIKNLSGTNDINKYIKFSNGDIIIIDIVRYKFNLEEYYINKNPKEKKDIYRVDIVLSSPVNLINNTPYEFSVNNDNKIDSKNSLNIYYNNYNLISDYIKTINEKDKKHKINEKQIIFKIIKDLKFQIIYNDKLLTADTLIKEKVEKNDENKTEEGATINNFSLYNKSLSILLKDDATKEYLICRLFLNNPYEFLSYNNKTYEEMKTELNSIKYEIAFDYYFVNRTALNLYLNNKTIDEIKTNDKNKNYLIPAKKYIPLSKVIMNNKAQLRGSNNYWSDKFEPSAIGEDFTFNIKQDDNTFRSLCLQVRISTVFNKSRTFIIEDKYVIVNDLCFDIKLKDDKTSTFMNIKSNEYKVLLLNKESLDKKNNYRIGIDNCYSHKFDLDKLGSYDLLINYEEGIFAKKNIDIENKLVELNNKKYYPVRCVINSINKRIYILFSYNKEYINQFKNQTSHDIEIMLNEDKQSKCIVKPNKTIPLIYYHKDVYQPFEKVKITFDDKTSETVTLNEIDTKFSGKNKKYIIKIQPDKNNSIKCITVSSKDDLKYINEVDIKDRIKKFTKVSGSNIKLYIYGIGISIINEIPKEVFYLSLYEIHLCYKYSEVTNILNETEYYNSLLFSLKNLQLDYCLDNAYDIIFNPTNQLLPPKSTDKDKKKENFMDKVLKDDEDNTPFIQFVISQEIRQKKNTLENILIYSVYPEIAIIVQEFDIRINTVLLNSLINTINEYIKIFIPVEDDNNELKKIEDINKKNDTNLLIDIYNDEYIAKTKDKLLNKEGKISNLVINYLTLSALKLNITFKVNKNTIEIRYIPAFIISLTSSLSSFSDATIKLKELIISNVFSDLESLSAKLITYYKHQVLAQIYKIIFNIDLLGNPLNLLEGLGTGLFQLFNEPRKGLLKGPEEFGLGIARGARSLVSNTVGTGFKSVSKITGTLLNATKNLSSIGVDEEVVTKEEEKPKGFLKGTFSGFKKGFGELAHGVTGIVTKPIEQTKKSGVGGFFKGTVSGLMGAVLAPVNTVLTIGNEVTTGISESEFISNNKKLRRFRHPRTLYKHLPIRPYNEEKELERKNEIEKIGKSQKIIISLSNEKLHFENSTEIVLCKQLKDSTVILFTDVMIKIMDDKFKKYFKKIYVCDIKEKKENNNDIEIIMKNESKEIFQFKNEKDKNLFIEGINKYLSY